MTTLPRSCSIVIGAATLSQSTAPSSAGAGIGPCCGSSAVAHRSAAPRPRLQLIGARHRFFRIEPRVDRPLHAPRPVHLVDDRGRVDAIGPAEDVLQRNQRQARAGRQQRLQDRGALFLGLPFRRRRQRLDVVRAGRGHRSLGEFRRIDRRLPVAIPMPLPAQHLQPRQIEARHRFAHKRRDRSEIFGDHRRAASRRRRGCRSAFHRARSAPAPQPDRRTPSSTCRSAGRTCDTGRRGDRCGSRRRDRRSGARARASRRSRSPPSRPARHGGSPQSWPVSLNASGGTPMVASKRNSCCRAHTSGLSAEFMNGRSPNTRDRPRQPFGLGPLLGRDPLQVGPVGDLRARARRAPRSTRSASARASGSGHCVHGSSSCSAMQRSEQRVLVEPPRLRRDERVESRGARRCRATPRA